MKPYSSISARTVSVAYSCIRSVSFNKAISQAVRTGVVIRRSPIDVICVLGRILLKTLMRLPCTGVRKCEEDRMSRVRGNSPPSHTHAAVIAQAAVPNGIMEEAIVPRPYKVEADSLKYALESSNACKAPTSLRWRMLMGPGSSEASKMAVDEVGLVLFGLRDLSERPGGRWPDGGPLRDM